MKETLSLASAAVPDRYTFAVNAPGLRASIDRAGGVVFVDAAGKTRFGFSAPWMQDASGALSRAAHYEIRTQGGQQQVVLVLDRRWLADPARQFPVKVDPTVYTDIWGVCELKSGADADVSTCTDGTEPVWIGNDGSEIHRASFGIDPASAGVPANALVTDAELTGWFDSQSVSEASDVDLYAGAGTLGTPYQTWNSYDGTHAWTTPGGDMRSQRESRRELEPDWTGWWVSFGMLNLAQERIQGTESNFDVFLKAADETRTHVDVLEDFVVKIDYRARTGLGSQYTFDHTDLSDGSGLDVNVANGNVVVSNTDAGLFSSDGYFGLSRFWNSMDDTTQHTFGAGWRGDAGSVDLTWNWVDGSYVLDGPSGLDGAFVKQPDGSFQAPAGIDATLTEESGGDVSLTFNDSGDRWEFDNGSPHKLVQIDQATGATIDLSYTSGVLSGLSDSDGNTLRLAYNRYGDLQTITDGNSTRRSYNYDSNHNLTAYTATNGAETQYEYSRAQQLTRIDLPNGTAVKIAYAGGAGSPPSSITPVDDRGVEGDPTTFTGGADYTTVHHPGEHDVTYFFDTQLHVNVEQTTDDPAVTATGSIVHRETTYDDGSTPYTLTAVGGDVPYGVHQLILEEDGSAVDTATADCSTSCPDQFSATLSHDPSRDSEGTHTYQIRVVDGDGNSGYSDTWTVHTDRTAPTTSASGFDASFDDADNTTDVTWNDGVDPPLADRTDGSPITQYRYRYQRGTEDWTDWATADSAALPLPDSIDGETISVEVQAVDAAGNIGPTASATLDSSPTDLGPDDVGSDLGYTTDSPADSEDDAPAETAHIANNPFSNLGYVSNDYYQFALCGGGSSPCGRYDGRAAAAYALKWDLARCGRSDSCAYDNHNASYGYYGGKGGDCTNFASQALKAGGMRFMRTRGVNSPNGSSNDPHNYLHGRGSWWSYYWDTPTVVPGDPLRSYETTQSWTHSNDLYNELIAYSLAVPVTRGRARPGDLVFYTDADDSPAFYHHTQIITRVTHGAIWVAQHSWAYNRPLASVLNGLSGERFAILHPTHTGANIDMDVTS